MKRLKLVTILAAALLLTAVLRHAGTFLVVSQLPQKADVIIVLSGDNGARLQEGMELYRQGYAPYLLYTSGADTELSQAVAGGIPANRFILDRQAQNTYQNAERAKALMEQYGLQSAMVVASDYHTRRASLMFARVFKSTGVHLCLRARFGLPPGAVVDELADGAADSLPVRRDSGILHGIGAIHHKRVDLGHAAEVGVQVHGVSTGLAPRGLRSIRGVRNGMKPSGNGRL